MENRIKDLRNANGVTQKQLSDYLGVKQNTLSYWERGVYDVDNASLQKIADFFGVTMDYLLCHDSSRTTGASANSQMSLARLYQKIICKKACRQCGDRPFQLCARCVLLSRLHMCPRNHLPLPF